MDEGNIVARVNDEVPRFEETLAKLFAFAKKIEIKVHVARTYL
jgi:ribosomal protein S25